MLPTIHMYNLLGGEGCKFEVFNRLGNTHGRGEAVNFDWKKAMYVREKKRTYKLTNFF